MNIFPAFLSYFVDIFPSTRENIVMQQRQLDGPINILLFQADIQMKEQD